jgi:NAD(P)H-dependent FMN reductase
MKSLTIKVIVGSIREGRFGDKPANWIFEHAKKMEGWNVELLDLRDYQLPQFNEAVSPAWVKGEYGNPDVDRWAGKIAEADGYIIVTPEYNHSFSSALKNNIDHLYKEWNKKAVGFVGYGLSGGASAIQHLRGVAVELQMAPIRSEIYIPAPWNLTEKDGSLKAGVLDAYEKSAENLLVQLDWWARALKAARA